MIRGYFDEQDRPMLRVHVAVLGPGSQGEVEFMVSTGSLATILSPRDTERLRVRYGNPGEDELSITNQYGQTMPVRKIPAAITLNQDRQKRRLETDLLVARPDAMEYTQPSVLGRDILGLLNMTMDPMKRRLEFHPGGEADQG